MATQSARQNATNSELDAKKIVTHSGLTSAQKDEVIEQYVNLLIDGMSMKDAGILDGDLVAVHRNTGKVLKIDVKSVSYRKTGPKKGHRINRVPSDAQKKIGVKLLYVYKDGRCDWNGKN